MESLRTLSEIPTMSYLYQSRVIVPSRTLVVATPSQTLNNIVSHIRHDITKLQVDCIVNAANKFLYGGGGVDSAIHSAAGRDLAEECLTLNGCDTGDAKITDAYRLPCRKVIHAVGPIYHEGRDQSEHLLRSCYHRSLQLAVENGLRSIAFSAISTGIFGYPNKEAARVAIKEVRDFLASDENASKFDRVVFCSFMPKDVRAYEHLLPSYFPPTEDDFKPTDDEESQDKNEDAVIVDQSDGRHCPRSEDEWEEVSHEENRGDLHEEPVEVDHLDQSASITDIQSMQSSNADFHELSQSETDLKGRTD